MTTALAGVNLSYLRQRRPVLRDVSILVPRGQVTVLIGPNGSGKTTLLWLLAGLLEPAQGRVAVADVPEGQPADPASLEAAAPARFPPGTLGMVFQSPALWEHLSVQEHLQLVLKAARLDRPERQRRLEAALARMQLEPVRRRRPGQLSGGQRQRLAIARAIVIHPQWLLLDEPLSHLDGSSREELLEWLRDALTGMHAGVVLSSHEWDGAARLADRITVLLDGAVAQCGHPREIHQCPASLQVARLTGAACELSGLAAGGRLCWGEQVVLDGLDGRPTGPVRLILRPEHLSFEPHPAGIARVRHCDWCGQGFVLTVELGSQRVQTLSVCSLAEGTHGRLSLTAPGRQVEPASDGEGGRP